MALFQRGQCIGLCDTVMVHRGENGPAPLPDALRTVLGEWALKP
jgi:acyl-CoA thioester hydrolase